jgi:hypothetical protein
MASRVPEKNPEETSRPSQGRSREPEQTLQSEASQSPDQAPRPEQSGNSSTASASVPELRREFVGIMFALAVGEVGLQAAALVQAGPFVRYLTAYSHLLLALVVIAASWVGWSRTRIAAAKKDVSELFEWAFIVLLLDTAMVVSYFIVVRTVDFSDGNRRIDSAVEVAFWHVVIFILYLIWDVVTKVAMFEAPKEHVGKRLWEVRDGRLGLLRIGPTVICLGLSVLMWRSFAGARAEHLLSADLALVSMVLLFRALKNLVSAIWQSDEDLKEKRPPRLLYRTGWTVFLSAGLLYGAWLTVYSRPLPLLPQWAIDEIRKPFAPTNSASGSSP